MKKPVVFTIGHSTHPMDEFIGILQAHQIQAIADVRTIPKSRHNPQFNEDDLKESLREAHIRYRHFNKLGGLRHAAKESVNLGWRNASFRGFADYMATEEFAAGLKALMKLASGKATAIMCAEAVPWRCHRSLVADALTARGHDVEHIMSETRLDRHKGTPFARVEGERVTYPGVI